MCMAITAHAKPEEDATPREPTHSVSKTTFSHHAAVMANMHLLLHLNFPSLLISIFSQLLRSPCFCQRAPAKTLCLTDTWCEPRTVFV